MVTGVQTCALPICDLSDVQIVSPTPCVVEIYLVMEDGRLPNETERESLEEYINGETIRPLTDQVFCKLPVEVEYHIDVSYWIAASDRKGAGTIQEKVASAVREFERWQRRLGRDVNPTELITRIRNAGAKRVKLTAPMDAIIRKTELPKCTGVTVVYGGLEDD